jgi:hypothetical protein
VTASVEKAHSNVSDTDRVIAAVDADRTVVRLDSSAKYAVVARGQADAYLRLPTRPTTSSGSGITPPGGRREEAGVRVTDIAGRPLEFSHGAVWSGTAASWSRTPTHTSAHRRHRHARHPVGGSAGSSPAAAQDLARLEQPEHLRDGVGHGLGAVEAEIGRLRRLVGWVTPVKNGIRRRGPLVQLLGVARLADFQGRVHEDLEEGQRALLVDTATARPSSR